jgi:PAS domain S-box-containing protein
MIPGLARLLGRSFGAPQRLHALLGAVGGALAAGAHFFQFGWPDGASLSFMPAVLMMAEIMGGWAASALAVAILFVASLLWKAQAIPLLVVALVAVFCGHLFRHGVRPFVSVVLLTATTLCLQVLAGTAFTALTWSMFAMALLGGSLNVTAAAAVRMLLPRRSAWLLPQRRWRIEDAMFVLGTAALAATAVMLSGFRDNLAAAIVLIVLAVNLAILIVGMLSEATALRLLKRLRAGRAAGVPPDERRGYANLPLEAALLFFGSRRESDRLHRLTAKQGLHLESAKRRVSRLQQNMQAGERQLREKELALSNAMAASTAVEGKWRAFLETVPDGMLIADGDGRIEFANGAIQNLLGYAPDKLIGTSVSALLARSAGAHDPLELAPLGLNGDPEPPAHESDVKFKDAHGVVRELATRVQGFYVMGERRVAIRLRDVSGLRYVVQELKQARRAAGSTQRARDQFIATMSHEIRTPLHGLMATLDMLRSESFTAEGRHRLSIARLSAKTLINIANDILDLSRINAGGMPLERKSMSLERLIGEVVDEARARAESFQLEVHTRISGRLPAAVLGDPVRIKQILANLLANALKFTEAGSVTLATSYSNGEWKLDVTDTGEGVPEDRRESIFDPFVQGDSASSRRFGGAGLGLPISRKLSEAMRGSLVLAQTGRGGSTFRLTLPLPLSDEPPLEEQSQRILQIVHGNVLVVEDDQSSQYVAQTLLESLKCPARIASNGAEALELLRAEEFDLVLMDCEMPELDGYETTRHARKLLEKHVPIIAMTASTMASDRQRCFDAGMDDILPKPFGKSALNDMLCKWLSPDSAGDAADTLAERVAALPTVDASVFDELRESLHWQLPPLRKIYASFQESASDTLKLVSGELPTVDHELEVRRLHSLQGSAGLVGARQIEHLAAWLGQAVKARKREEVDQTVPLLREAVRRFTQELDARMDAINGR